MGMDLLKKLEHTIAGWLKSVPHLPAEGRTWLGNNIWWIVIIGAVACGLAIISTLGVLFGSMALFGAVGLPSYVASTVVAWGIVHSLVALVFLVVQGILFVTAIQPLRAKVKRGWVLLFATLLVGALSIVLNAVLTLSIGDFIVSILMGAIGLAIGAYFIFEIHGEFAHDERLKKDVRPAEEVPDRPVDA
ncbi:hypothetical protein KI440_00540 [Candidatus Saccharibacteria bacterium TM7i]|nr:hypothetical protein KI440_00540 [Candidatus Saccharibacteria bacterium TM7i]